MFLFGHMCVLFLGPGVGWKGGRVRVGSGIYLDACEYIKMGVVFNVCYSCSTI